QERDWVAELKLSDVELKQLASVCLGLHAPSSASFLLRYLDSHDDNLTAYLQHAARYADASLVGDVIRVGKSKGTADVEVQAQIVQSLANGLGQRSGTDMTALAAWAQGVASKLMNVSDGDHISWTALPIDGLPPSENPWVISPRPSRDGDKDSLF